MSRRILGKTIILALLAASLAIPEVAQAEGMRGRERNIGAVLNLTASPDADNAEFHQSVFKVLQSNYGRRFVELKPSATDTDALIYLGAKEVLDHILDIKGTGSAQFDKKRKNVIFQFTGNIRIVDVASLKQLSDTPVEIKGEAPVEDANAGRYEVLARQLTQKLMAFYNPNLMTKMNPRLVGDYFYNKHLCPQAVTIYDYAAKVEDQFDLLDGINKNMAQCKRTMSTQARLGATYALDLKFEKLSPQYQSYFQQALKQGQFEASLKQFSAKPITLAVVYEGGDGSQGTPGEIVMTVYQDPARYKITALGSSTQRSLNLAPYAGFMKELIRFKWLAVKAMPRDQQQIFSKFSTRVRLEKADGDWLTYLVDIDRENRLIPPNKLILEVTGYKRTEVDAVAGNLGGNLAFTMGPAFNIDGKETVYNVVYKFFDIKP